MSIIYIEIYLFIRVQDIKTFSTPGFLYLFCSPGFANYKSEIKSYLCFKGDEIFHF